MMAFAPAENLVAIADAPPTIDAALKAAYDTAAIYFPFTDAIVADPYDDVAEGLKLAFFIGQSKVVGGTTTDMVAFASDGCSRRSGSAPRTSCRGGSRRLSRRPVAAAPPGGVLQLEARRLDPGGHFRVDPGRRAKRDPVRPPGPRPRAYRRTSPREPAVEDAVGGTA